MGRMLGQSLHKHLGHVRVRSVLVFPVVPAVLSLAFLCSALGHDGLSPRVSVLPCTDPPGHVVQDPTAHVCTSSCILVAGRLCTPSQSFRSLAQISRLWPPHPSFLCLSLGTPFVALLFCEAWSTLLFPVLSLCKTLLKAEPWPIRPSAPPFRDASWGPSLKMVRSPSDTIPQGSIPWHLLEHI